MLHAQDADAPLFVEKVLVQENNMLSRAWQPVPGTPWHAAVTGVKLYLGFLFVQAEGFPQTPVGVAINRWLAAAIPPEPGRERNRPR